jgi:hypothetical protein
MVFFRPEFAFLRSYGVNLAMCSDACLYIYELKLSHFEPQKNMLLLLKIYKHGCEN